MRWEDIKPHTIGRWHEILRAHGLSDQQLRDKHQPCPACGGTDRYRFDDKDGSGSYFCSQCGAGDGMSLLVKSTGMKFREALDSVASFLGLNTGDFERRQCEAPPKPKKPLTDRKQNRTAPEKAQQWLDKCEPRPFSPYTIHRIIPATDLVGTATAIVIPIYGHGELVNAAAIADDGRIAYAAGGFTYGGYTECGQDDGKSIFICCDWGDAWITSKSTGCLTLCCWSPANFYDVYKQAVERYEKPVYLAININDDELAAADSVPTKCIIPDGSDLIEQARKFKRALFDASEL